MVLTQFLSYQRYLLLKDANLRELSALSPQALLDGRYAKYRAIGSFTEQESSSL